MTCFYADHGENAVIVPQYRYWPPPEDWHSSQELMDWQIEHISPAAITFLAGGKFGVSVKDALEGNLKVNLRVVDDKAQIYPYFSLHIMVSVWYLASIYGGHHWLTGCSIPDVPRAACRPRANPHSIKKGRLMRLSLRKP